MKQMARHFRVQILHPPPPVLPVLRSPAPRAPGFTATTLLYRVEPPRPRPLLRLVRAFRTNSVVSAVAFAPDGSYFAFANLECVFLVGAADGRLRRALEIPGPAADVDSGVRTIEISEDRGFLAINGASNNVVVFDLAGARGPASLAAHTATVTACAFSGDSRTLYSGGLDGSFCVWSLADMSLVRRLTHGTRQGREMISSISLDRDGAFVVVGFMSGHVGLYDSAFSQPMNIFVSTDACLMDAVISPFDGTVATGAHDKLVKIWALRGVASLRRTLAGHDGRVMKVCFAPHRAVLLSASQDETVRAWDYEKGELLLTMMGHSNTVFGLAHHPTERQFLSAGGDELVCLWEYDV
jgi:WD40 repeat protein